MVLEIVKSFSKGGNTYLLSKNGENAYDFSKIDRWGVRTSISEKLYTDNYIYRTSVYNNSRSVVPRNNKMNGTAGNSDLFIKDGSLVIEGQMNKGKMSGQKPLIAGEKSIVSSGRKLGALAKKYLARSKEYLKSLVKSDVAADGLKLAKFI